MSGCCSLRLGFAHAAAVPLAAAATARLFASKRLQYMLTGAAGSECKEAENMANAAAVKTTLAAVA
jgi:hypothetical protein